MASTTSLAISLALLMVCINGGVTMVIGSGFAEEMGVENIGLGITEDIAEMNAALNQNEFTPVAIGSAFAGFTINGVQVLIKAFVLLSIGFPHLLQAAGAPVWLWGPIATIFVMIQGLAAMGLYFNAQV